MATLPSFSAISLGFSKQSVSWDGELCTLYSLSAPRFSEHEHIRWGVWAREHSPCILFCKGSALVKKTLRGSASDYLFILVVFRDAATHSFGIVLAFQRKIMSCSWWRQATTPEGEGWMWGGILPEKAGHQTQWSNCLQGVGRWSLMRGHSRCEVARAQEDEHKISTDLESVVQFRYGAAPNVLGVRTYSYYFWSI